MVHVAVIGAGASGLAAIKCCIDEGLDVTCIEASDHIGGLWYFTEEEEHSSIYRSTVINTSKEMMSFSTFPVPDNFPVYMHNTKVLEYLNLYADHFNARKYIKFNTKVINVSRISQERDSKYKVTYAKFGKEITGQVTEIFDAVMVCTGHHWKYTLPKFDGMDNFKGVQIHSKAYKDFQRFKDKVVVVVGIGNSGGDIAVELSRHCKKVYLSTRKGAWILPRIAKGHPLDQSKSRRVFQFLPKILLYYYFKATLASLYDLDLMGLKPKTPLFSHHPMVNDMLPWKILNSSIIVKPNLKYLEETNVVFEDDTVVHNVDAIIYCTGFEIEFPFLAPDLVKCENNRVELYKNVFPPDQRNLAIIGCVQPLGSTIPLSEMQSRWVTRVFKGVAEIPTKEEMLEEINLNWIQMQSQYYASKRHTIQVHYVSYADDLSNKIGCHPLSWRTLFTDPRLWLYCLFGPVYPYQYRLRGPGAWSGARKALFAAEKNVLRSLMTRRVNETSGDYGFVQTALLIMMLVLFISVFAKVLL